MKHVIPRLLAAFGSAAGAAPAWAADAVPLATDAGQVDESIQAMLPKDLSAWGMFLSADIVVQAVMVGLLFASVLTWTVWLSKTLEIAAGRRRVRAALSVIAKSRTLDEAAFGLKGAEGTEKAIIETARVEIGESEGMTSDGVKERIAWQMERLEASAGRRASRGTGVLATIGATAPFVGLFGTVWGIMNSFIGISKAHTTNLAVVAPGIAEALLATALGLVAAIPAVVIYNHFSRAIAAYRAQLADVSALVLRLVSRDLDRGLTRLARAAE